MGRLALPDCEEQKKTPWVLHSGECLSFEPHLHVDESLDGACFVVAGSVGTPCGQCAGSVRATCGQRRRPVWATACRPGNQKPRPGAWTGVSWALSRSLQSMVRSGAKGGISRLLLTIAPVTSAPRLGNSLPPWEPKTTTGCLDLSFLGPAQVPTIDGSPRSEGEHFKVTSDHCPGRRAPGWAFYFPAQGAHFKTMRTLRDLESHGRCAPPPPRKGQRSWTST